MSDRDLSPEKTLLLFQFSILLAIEAIVCFTPLGSIPLASSQIVATLSMIPVVIAGILFGLWGGVLLGAFAGLFSFIVWTFMPPSVMAFAFTPFAPPIGDIHGNFWSLLICFAPRIGAGVVAASLFTLLNRILDPDDMRAWTTYLTGAAVASAVSTAVITIIIYVISLSAFDVFLDPVSYWGIPVALFFALGVLFYFLFRKHMSPATTADIVTYGASAVAGSMTNTICVLGGVYLFFGDDYAEVMRMDYDAMMDVISLSAVTNGIPEAVLSALCAYFIARIIMKRRKRVQW
jgi:uncharacterized membrane protein